MTMFFANVFVFITLKESSVFTHIENGMHYTVENCEVTRVNFFLNTLALGRKLTGRKLSLSVVSSFCGRGDTTRCTEYLLNYICPTFVILAAFDCHFSTNMILKGEMHYLQILLKLNTLGQ